MIASAQERTNTNTSDKYGNLDFQDMHVYVFSYVLQRCCCVCRVLFDVLFLEDVFLG